MMSEVSEVLVSSPTAEQQLMQNMQQQLLAQQQQILNLQQQIMIQQLQQPQQQLGGLPPYNSAAGSGYPAAGNNPPGCNGGLPTGYNGPVVITTPDLFSIECSPVGDVLNTKAMKRWGVLLIAGGNIAMALAIVGLVSDAQNANIGAGFWCGLFFIVAGAVALHAARFRQSSVIMTSVIASFMSAVFAVVLFAFSLNGLLGDLDSYYKDVSYYLSTASSGSLSAVGVLAFISSLAVFLHSIGTTICCQKQMNPAADSMVVKQQQQQQQQLNVAPMNEVYEQKLAFIA